jgi:hypothetical protein
MGPNEAWDLFEGLKNQRKALRVQSDCVQALTRRLGQGRYDTEEGALTPPELKPGLRRVQAALDDADAQTKCLQESLWRHPFIRYFWEHFDCDPESFDHARELFLVESLHEVTPAIEVKS